MPEFELRPGLVYPDELKQLVEYLGHCQRISNYDVDMKLIEKTIIKMAKLTESIADLRAENMALHARLDHVVGAKYNAGNDPIVVFYNGFGTGEESIFDEEEK